VLEALAKVLIVEEEDDREEGGEDQRTGHQLLPDPGLPASLDYKKIYTVKVVVVKLRYALQS